VQGLGAVSGPVTALLADVTRTPVRTRAMAFIGVSIGASFIVALVAGPLLDALLGVPGIFWLMALLAGLGLLLLYLVAPSPPAGAGIARAPLAHAFAAPLRPYYLGIFCLHFILTATFIAVPHVLHDLLGIPTRAHWMTYLGVFVASLAGTVPLVLWAERSRVPDGVLRIGIAILMVGLGLLAFLHADYWPMAAALAVFFAAFNFVEARLPARLSQLAGVEVRGTALGLFGTCQFAGAFAGGVAGGAMFGSHFGLTGVFGMASLLAMLWVLLYRPGTAPVA
jgi:predicted MFS family arabinose efflux permease